MAPLIVFYGGCDWANTSNRVARAIRRAGGQAYCYSERPHPYGYEEDGRPDPDVIRRADWLISCGDADYELFWDGVRRFGVDVQRTRFAIRHSGTRLRDEPHLCDEQDKRFERRFVPCDLYEQARHMPGTHVFVQPQERILRELPPLPEHRIVIHTPSCRRTKGTKHIVQALQRCRQPLDWRISEQKPFEEIYAERNQAQVYIDQLAEPFGNFGAAACEAMANGVATVADLNRVKPNGEIPKPPIVDVRTKEQLTEVVNRLVTEDDYLQRVRRESLEWAQTYLSDEFTRRHWEGCLQ